METPACAWKSSVLEKIVLGGSRAGGEPARRRGRVVNVPFGVRLHTGTKIAVENDGGGRSVRSGRVTEESASTPP